MKPKSRMFCFAAASVLVLGLPAGSLLVLDPTAPEAPLAETQSPLAALVASQSDIDRVFQQWETGYLRNGGDRHTVVDVGYVYGLSKEQADAAGKVDLDLLGGTLKAEVTGLDPAADLWLVDNEEGKSVTPQPGDRLVRVGRLERQAGKSVVSASLGEDFFRGFELDLIVVTRAGQSPVDSRILVGSRSLFERMHTRNRLAAPAGGHGAGALASLAGLLEPRKAEANAILVNNGLVSSLVDNGGNLFFRGTFGGNGRTCGTCHRVEANQGIEADFIAELPPEDKLFVAEHAVSQGGVPGLERPNLMRNFGLILENVDGLENPTVKFAMRGVPHSLSMAASILAPADGRAPVQRTGWSGDGAPLSGALRFFPVGAVTQHFTKRLNRVEGVDFVLPSDAQLDAMAAFMLACGRLNELNLNAVTMSNSRAEAGRLAFLGPGKCNGCHGNAGAISTFGGNRNFDTGVEEVTNPAQAVETFPLDGGFGGGGAFNFDSDGDGIPDSIGDGTFNTPPLIEAVDNAPFFHNNIAATIEDATAFYSTPEFNNSPGGALVGGIALTTQQNEDIGAFLRVLNASFNLSIAIQRADAALALENVTTSNPLTAFNKRVTVDNLLILSNEEIADAIDVLSEEGLHPTAVGLNITATLQNLQALVSFSTSQRKQLIQQARNNLATAKGQLGTGMSFTMGSGNLVF